MNFKGRNGGMAIAMRNHIMMFRAFLISLLVFLIPTLVFICIGNPYFWVFLIMPSIFLIISFAIFLFANYDENVFLSSEKKDHVFEIKNDCLFKDGKEIKLIKSIKVYCYKNFLYMESRFSVYGIAEGVWHHRRCISLRLDSIQCFALIPYRNELRIPCTALP